jgi:hypothetical protein
MTTTSPTPAITDRTVAQEFLVLFIQIPLALFGGMLSYAIGRIMLRFVSFALDLNVHRFPSFFTDVYAPFFWLANLLFGFLVARHVRSSLGPG